MALNPAKLVLGGQISSCKPMAMMVGAVMRVARFLISKYERLLYSVSLSVSGKRRKYASISLAGQSAMEK